MREPEASPLRWIVPVVLASAAGLLILGMRSLSGAARESRALAAAERDRAASATAGILRRAAGALRFLERLPLEARFLIRDGELVVPESVGWLDEPELGAPELDLPWTALSRLREARSAALVDGDRDRARKLLAEALATEGVPERGRTWILLAQAWTAHRAGDPAERDAVLDELESRLEILPLPVAAGAILLRSAARGETPASAEAVLGRLPEARTQALLDRLGEIGGLDDARLAELARAARRVAATRRTLRIAREHLALLTSTRSSAPQALDGARLLLFHPETGEGAVASASDVAAALWQATELSANAGRLVSGPDLPEHAVAVLPLIALLPGSAEVTIGWWERWGLMLLLALLGLCFGLGLALALRALRREAQAARARGEFLTSVTHELRTPLASIRLLTDLLDQGKVTDPERQREYYRLLAAETGRLNVLVENVLDLGRMERGERAFDKRPIRIADVVAEAVEVFAPLATRDGLTVRAELASSEAIALADRAALVQAFLNLMENARKYAGEGGVLDITAEGDEQRCDLHFRDRGPGIPPEDRPALFARFQRGAAHRNGGIPGLGLGLHLARGILREHGGELRFEAPEDGVGACFVATLPRAAEEAAVAAPAEAAP